MGESTQHLTMYKIILPVTCSLSLSLSFIVCLFFISQDLESKSLVDEILVDRLSTNGPVECMSLAWSADGQTLFAGYTDNLHSVSNVVCVCVHMCVVCPPRGKG